MKVKVLCSLQRLRGFPRSHVFPHSEKINRVGGCNLVSGSPVSQQTECLSQHTEEMGGGESKPESPVLDEPWRQINWDDKQHDVQFLNDYAPQTDVEQLRILLHGPIGAGKSSFVNSVKTVLEGKMCRKAPVAKSVSSYTKEYKTYKVQKGSRNTFFSFVLNDTMGLKYGSYKERRIHVKDIKRVMKGQVKDGYVFNPESKISKDDRFYNASPTPDDKVHVLVCVIDASTLPALKKENFEAIQEIRDEAGDRGIPHVTILTKIDEAFPEIHKDLKNVYRSKALKKRMEQFSADVGFPLNCIFPVKNYHSEINLNSDNDILILNALRNIINIGEERLSNRDE
ncbi:hypothetical protein L3Q82_011456 [Scortum barcoo]|uniref:Uncharacterized protein n=1 Tax=Scortum barcoo TaxID=214431 RepID=A0ACB8WAE6_9TELE|nr:hypothetical protein L3Q82_011456 [Scortum barcoo]